MISIWERESFFTPQDIIIVGNGFVGLWSAFHLKRKEPNLKITIVDRGVIPTGASTRNAGFACFGSLSELMQDAKTMGAEKMLELVEMRYKGLEKIQKYFCKKEIDFDLCGGYELYDQIDKTSSKKLIQNIEYVNSLLKPITNTKQTFKLIDNKIPVFGFGNTKHLIKNKLEGYLHSGKLVQALSQTVQSMGVQVFTGTEIKTIEKINGDIELITNQQFNLIAKRLH